MRSHMEKGLLRCAGRQQGTPAMCTRNARNAGNTRNGRNARNTENVRHALKRACAQPYGAQSAPSHTSLRNTIHSVGCVLQTRTCKMSLGPVTCQEHVHVYSTTYCDIDANMATWHVCPAMLHANVSFVFATLALQRCMLIFGTCQSTPVMR